MCAPLDVRDARPTVADASDAFPCRRCLTDAEPGETLLLLSYDPWLVDSPYRQPGPVFVHEQCETAVVTALPEQQRRRLLSVRAFDAEGMARDAFVVHGSELDLDRVLADAACEQGLVRLDRGDRAAAKVWFQRAVEIDPEHAEAASRLKP